MLLDVKLTAAERDQVPKLVAALARSMAAHPDLSQRGLELLTTELEVFFLLRELLEQDPMLGGARVVADFELPGVVQIARRIGARHVGIGLPPTRSWRAVRSELRSAIAERRKGELLELMVWTINDEPKLREVLELGVDAVLTDDVPLACHIQRKLSLRSPAP
jgi:hypothetical protein